MSSPHFPQSLKSGCRPYHRTACQAPRRRLGPASNKRKHRGWLSAFFWIPQMFHRLAIILGSLEQRWAGGWGPLNNQSIFTTSKRWNYQKPTLAVPQRYHLRCMISSILQSVGSNTRTQLNEDFQSKNWFSLCSLPMHVFCRKQTNYTKVVLSMAKAFPPWPLAPRRWLTAKLLGLTADSFVSYRWQICME